MKERRPITADTRRGWLERHEVRNESISRVADSVGRDVRTVRKHIRLASQERDSQDARSMVLRSALERHNASLLAVVENVDSNVANNKANAGADKTDRMWKALREHLPRPSFWRLLEKWEQLQADRGQIEEAAIKRAQVEVMPKAPAQLSEDGDVAGINPAGLARLVIHRLVSVARASETAPGPEDVLRENAANGSVNLVCGSATCASVANTDVDKVTNFLRDLQIKIAEWPEVDAIKSVLSNLTKVTSDLQEELATIILRGIVPGRCKYCPF